MSRFFPATEARATVRGSETPWPVASAVGVTTAVRPVHCSADEVPFVRIGAGVAVQC